MMKRTMATVIVGPTIGSSASVFAPERGRCGTAAKANWRTMEAVKARTAEPGCEVSAIKAERGCFGMKAVDNGVRLEPGVNLKAGISLKPEARREGRS
jgi:Peptidase propeptide and YPEB domain